MTTNTIIENTAIELCAEVYDQYRRDGGIDFKYKNQRAFVKANFTKYIPLAVKYLTELLCREGFPDDAKQEIYDALTERAAHMPKINGAEVADKTWLN